MTAKDYRSIAAAIRDARRRLHAEEVTSREAVIELLIQELIPRLRENPAFDDARFREACESVKLGEEDKFGLPFTTTQPDNWIIARTPAEQQLFDELARQATALIHSTQEPPQPQASNEEDDGPPF